MNFELAEYLIGLDKYVVQNGEVVKTFMVDIQFPMSFRLTLTAPDDLDQIYWLTLKKAKRNLLKLACTIKTVALKTAC